MMNIKKSILFGLGLCIASGSVFADASDQYNFGVYNIYLPTNQTGFVKYSVTFSTCSITDPNCDRTPSTPIKPNNNLTFVTACIPLSAKPNNELLAGNAFLINSLELYSLYSQIQKKAGFSTTSINSIYIQDEINKNTWWTERTRPFACKDPIITPTNEPGRCQYTNSQANNHDLGQVYGLYLTSTTNSTCPGTSPPTTSPSAEHPYPGFN
jgi:hypothetical protein